MQNWYSHEEYLRLYNQSRMLAEQRAQLESPFFSTNAIASPGGNPGVEEPTSEVYTMTMVFRVAIDGETCIFAFGSLPVDDQQLTVNWGDGTEDVYTLTGNSFVNCSHRYTLADVYTVTVKIPNPDGILSFDASWND